MTIVSLLIGSIVTLISLRQRTVRIKNMSYKIKKRVSHVHRWHKYKIVKSAMELVKVKCDFCDFTRKNIEHLSYLLFN